MWTSCTVSVTDQVREPQIRQAVVKIDDSVLHLLLGTPESVTCVCFFLRIEFTGVTLVNKIIQFRVHSSVQHILCALYCVFTTPSQVSFHHHLSPRVNLHLSQRSFFSPGWCGSFGWSVVPWPEGCRFSSQSGHMPGLQVLSPVCTDDPRPRHVRSPVGARFFPPLCLESNGRMCSGKDEKI